MTKAVSDGPAYRTTQELPPSPPLGERAGVRWHSILHYSSFPHFSVPKVFKVSSFLESDDAPS